MDDVRQWWLHTARPAMHRVRWFAAGWLVLALVAVPWGLRAQERHLESESREAFATAGISVEDVAFTGRTAVVTGSLTAHERLRAERALAEVTGIRGVEWSVTLVAAPEVPTTTTTAAPAKDEVASLEVKIVAGRLAMRGVVPDAATIAAIGATADRLYGPDIANGIIVGDVYEAAWSGDAVDVISTLPMVGDATVRLDADGVAIAAVASDESVADAFAAAVSEAVGPGIPVDISVEVTPGRLPAISITDAGDGSIVVAGALPRRKAVDELVAAVEAGADGAEVEADVAVDKTLDDTYIVGRLPLLTSRLASADAWSLSYRRGLLIGSLDGGGFFRKQTLPTARLEHVIEQLAVLMVGDPSLRLTLDIGVAGTDTTDDAADDTAGAAAVELARRRSFSILGALTRAGVDPGRVAASVAPDGGETLRFRLEPAER